MRTSCAPVLGRLVCAFISTELFSAFHITYFHGKAWEVSSLASLLFLYYSWNSFTELSEDMAVSLRILCRVNTAAWPCSLPQGCALLQLSWQMGQQAWLSLTKQKLVSGQSFSPLYITCRSNGCKCFMKWNIQNIVKWFDILFTVLLLLQWRINLDTPARLAAGAALENASRLLKARSMHFLLCALLAQCCAPRKWNWLFRLKWVNLWIWVRWNNESMTRGLTTFLHSPQVWFERGK